MASIDPCLTRANLGLCLNRWIASFDPCLTRANLGLCLNRVAFFLLSSNGSHVCAP